MNPVCVSVRQRIGAYLLRGRMTHQLRAIVDREMSCYYRCDRTNHLDHHISPSYAPLSSFGTSYIVIQLGSVLETLEVDVDTLPFPNCCDIPFYSFTLFGASTPSCLPKPSHGAPALLLMYICHHNGRLRIGHASQAADSGICKASQLAQLP